MNILYPSCTDVLRTMQVSKVNHKHLHHSCSERYVRKTLTKYILIVSNICIYIYIYIYIHDLPLYSGNTVAIQLFSQEIYICIFFLRIFCKKNILSEQKIFTTFLVFPRERHSETPLPPSKNSLFDKSPRY